MTENPTIAAAPLAPIQTPYPTVVLKLGQQRRLLSGHPWVYSNEVAMDPPTKALAPGQPVRLVANDGRGLGTAFFNPHSLIAARWLSADMTLQLDAAFLTDRLQRAAALREALFDAPYYRLIHAEADGLPGCIVDRYGDVFAVQSNSAGMAQLEPTLIAALQSLFRPRAILLRNDSSARAREALSPETRWALGEVDGPIELIENGVTFFADLNEGQKTGWFFDQRDNRARVARLAKGRSLLDVYCYSGGFAVTAAKAGAREVQAIDRSEAALALAERAALRNDVAQRCRFARADAFQALEEIGAGTERYEIVVADPPAFVKSKKELPQGQRAYRKLMRLAAGAVAPGGFLFIASCSHNMEPALFAEAVARGLQDSGRSGRLLGSFGAAADHPVHPALPESAYLKASLLQID